MVQVIGRRVLPLLAVVALLLTLVPPVAAATLGTFGIPTATSTYAKGVTFTQRVTISAPLARVELLLTSGDPPSTTVVALPAPSGSGQVTLSNTIDPADGHILPNTTMTARWRLVSTDTSVSEVGPPITITYADDRFQWQTTEGKIVRVHWYEGSAAFGARALRIGEDAIKETSDLLGVTETKPVDFYIYADEASFRDALGPGTRENVGGEAIASIRTLFALIPPAQIDDAWVGIVIPHELTHLVFNTAAQNPYHFPPRWLNEGLAVYNSQGYVPSDRSQVEDAAQQGTLIPLDGLTGQFPTSAEKFYLAYAESVSAVDYMIRTYTDKALVALINSYADGRTDDEAFKAALGVDTATFAQDWLTDLKAVDPTRYGPQPAAAGPVPSGWTSGGAVPGAPAPARSAAPGAPASAAPGAPAPVEPASSDGGTPWLPVVVGVVLLIAAIVVLASRRRRTSGVAAGVANDSVLWVQRPVAPPPADVPPPPPAFDPWTPPQSAPTDPWAPLTPDAPPDEAWARPPAVPPLTPPTTREPAPPTAPEPLTPAPTEPPDPPVQP